MEIVNDHVVEEGIDHEELGIKGFDFNLFNEYREGCIGENVKDFTYLLIIIWLWPGDL